MYDYFYKVLLFRGPGVDISSLTPKSFLTPSFLSEITVENSIYTIGANGYSKTIVFDNMKIKLLIWDCSREERFREIMPSFAKGANGAIFIYDIVKYTVIDELQTWINEIKDSIRTEIDIFFPIVVFGNRSNLTQVNSKFHKLEGVNQFIEGYISTEETIKEAFTVLTRLMLSITNKNL